MTRTMCIEKERESKRTDWIAVKKKLIQEEWDERLLIQVNVVCTITVLPFWINKMSLGKDRKELPPKKFLATTIEEENENWERLGIPEEDRL